jgi:CIC family chloride channel protein
MLQFYVELPAFLLLGLVSGLIAVASCARSSGRRTWAPRAAADGYAALAAPGHCRAAAGGASRSGFPHIIGVGYETTSPR